MVSQKFVDTVSGATSHPFDEGTLSSSCEESRVASARKNDLQFEFARPCIVVAAEPRKTWVRADGADAKSRLFETGARNVRVLAPGRSTIAIFSS